MTKKLNITLVFLCVALSLVFVLITYQFKNIDEKQYEIEPNLDNYAAAEILILSLERVKNALLISKDDDVDNYLLKLDIFKSKVKILENRSLNQSSFYHDENFLQLEQRLNLKVIELDNLTFSMINGGVTKDEIYNYIEEMKPLLADVQEAIYRIQIKQFEIVKRNILDNYNRASILSALSILLVVMIFLVFIRNVYYLKSLISKKNLFISAIYHELASSTQSIAIAADILEHELQGEYLQNEVRIVNNNAYKIMEQTKEIMDFAKIEMKKSPVKKNKFQINVLISSILSDFNNKNNNYCKFYPSTFNNNICSDVYKISRIVANLLDNAGKHTMNGKICLHAKIFNNNLYLRVTDTGTGFDINNLNYLYKPFNQGAERETKQGLGLGLTIIKYYVSSLKGKVVVKSVIGTGSSFFVYIPNVLGIK